MQTWRPRSICWDPKGLQVDLNLQLIQKTDISVLGKVAFNMKLWFYQFNMYSTCEL